MKQRYPDAWTPGRSDLCFATTNRQSALMELAARCDAIVVIAHGRVVARGTPDELRKQTGHDNLEDAFVALAGAELMTEDQWAE